MPDPIGFQPTRPNETPTIGFARIRQSLMMRGNALRAINPDRLGMAIDAYRLGHIAPMARICESLAARDDTWVIAEEKYKAAVARCAWEILPLEGHEKDPAALEQAEALRKAYASLTATHALKGDVKGGVRRLVKQMLEARALGWSVHEITVAYHGLEPHLTLTQAPLWWFEATTGRLRYLPADYATYGEPLLPGRWLIHGGAGIGVACAIAALFKRLSLEDWLIWSERFGQPGIHGVTSAVPESPEWEQAVQALRAYSADWQVLTGEGVRFEPITAGNAGAIPYPKLVERMDRAIATLWRGADLSTLSAGTGEGSGASLQGDEADLIEQDACAEISETLHTTLDRLIVDLLQGPQAPLLATFALTPQSRPDATREIAIDTHLVNLGAKLSLRDALARYRRTEADPTDPDDRPLTPPEGLAPPLAPTAGPSPARQNLWNEGSAAPAEPARPVEAEPTAALQSLAQALQADFTPAADALQTLLKDPSPQAAQALIARLPQLLPQDPEMAAILEEELTKTFADTLAAEPAPPEPSRPVAPRLRDAPTVANSAHEPIRGGNPDNRGQFSKTPGAGQREGETKSHRDEHGTHDEAKLAADPRANRARAKSVITHLLAKKGGTEPKALYRKDTGWIGIDYGEPGNPNNAYKGGHGLAHILAKHPGAEKNLLEVLQKGECYKHDIIKSKLYLIQGNSVAVLTKHRTGRLLITDYEEVPDQQIAHYKSAGRYHAKGEN